MSAVHIVINWVSGVGSIHRPRPIRSKAELVGPFCQPVHIIIRYHGSCHFKKLILKDDDIVKGAEEYFSCFSATDLELKAWVV